MKKVLILGIVAIMLQSCATIFNGSRQTVTFNSEPSGATVYFGKYKNKYEIYKLNKNKAISKGQTPITISMKRKTPLIFISKDGCKDSIIYCKKSYYRLKYADAKTGLVTNHKYKSAKYSAKINLWYFGNIIFGFGIGTTIGMCTDLITGAYIRLNNEMNVKLKPTK